MQEKWKTRDRKHDKRVKLKQFNKVDLKPAKKKPVKPRVEINRKLSEIDLDEVFSL